MATIEFRDVSMNYSAPMRDPLNSTLENRRGRIQEDLPTETSKGINALDHINLTIPDGQTFVVVGPSGCGKSTLLRVAAGIVNDYSGQVLYDGQDVYSIPPGERYIGMVFQSYALYPNFNNEGNLSFFFKMHKIDDEATNERIRYTSELMGIDFKDLLPRKPGTLSGGEKQRVAIARAIVRAPKLFLFDEPLSNLDAKLRVQTRTEIKRLLRQFEITSLYVTHDQVEALALADQIVVMHAGKIQQVGTYQDLMENPVNEFVAGFFGLDPMGLFPGGSISGGRLVLGEYSFPLSKRVYPLVENGQLVTVGMRREGIKISAETQSLEANQFRAEVEALEPDLVHRVQIVYARMGQYILTGLCPIEVDLHLGQLICMEIDPERLYFFDTTSGLRL